MSLKTHTSSIDLETVKHECYGEQCSNLVTTQVWPGTKPPQKFCHACKQRQRGTENDFGALDPWISYSPTIKPY